VDSKKVTILSMMVVDRGSFPIIPILLQAHEELGYFGVGTGGVNLKPWSSKPFFFLHVLAG